MGKKPQDLTGRPFGLWTAIRQDGCDSHGNAYWFCRCKCGNERRVLACNLLKGTSQSCGCLKLEKTIARSTKHGLTAEHKRLLHSVTSHYHLIRTKRGRYADWSIDPRYDSKDGRARFCFDVIALYPEECKRYEIDRTLVIDKDNDPDRIFRPESLRFVTELENNYNRCDTSRVNGVPLIKICREEGLSVRENGQSTRIYKNIQWMWRRNQKIHPILWNARKQNLEKEERLLEITKLKCRHAELMIAGLKELLSSKQTA